MTRDNLPRILRGGSGFSLETVPVRAATRYTVGPLVLYDSVGFRCGLRGRQPVGAKP